MKSKHLSLILSVAVSLWLLMLLTGIKAGDHRNWDSIRAWVKEIAATEKR